MVDLVYKMIWLMTSEQIINFVFHKYKFIFTQFYVNFVFHVFKLPQVNDLTT